MDIETRKRLTEFLGECWHEKLPDECNQCRYCRIWKKRFVDWHRTFTTLQDFGDLWEALEKKGLLIKFLEGYRVRWIHQEDHENCCWDTRQVVNKDRFPELVVQFGKENPNLFTQ